MLTDDEIDRFIAEGFVVARQAIPAAILEVCRAELDLELRRAGVDIEDPTTWIEPIVRFSCPNTPTFASAGTQPVLWQIYDQLLGPGRHIERHAVGGSVPVRFPSDSDPGDAGWHIDSSFPIGDTWGVNYRSMGRGLLCLFLFSDIGVNDAPTEIKVGSHLHVPRTLEPMGEAGGSYDVKQTDAFEAIAQLPSALATGQAGDVYVCHPFLVHRATWPHRGSQPRFIAQPGIDIKQPFELTGAETAFPVERAIPDGLTKASPRPGNNR
ncbi:MAG: phytanoyl-CoA dioxygenase [Acidimicrobiia bacterium]